MWLQRLEVRDLRSIAAAELLLAPGWNLLIGGNGAGKTTVLEAAYLLAHGHSFRSGAREALVRQGCGSWSVYGEVASAGRVTRAGLMREGGNLLVRLDGAAATAAELVRRVAVLCFGPGSQDFISGPAELRRRFMDWGVFHVEHAFLDDWRRYQRAWRQRNAVLRTGAAGGELDAWDHELVAAAAPLSAARERWFERWLPWVAHYLAAIVPALGAPAIALYPGHDASRPLADRVAERRARDLARGYGSVGPHRADWRLSFRESLRREHLSRGQEKLCALACLLAQARLFAEVKGEWPVLCLDDVASELDRAHRGRLFELLAGIELQVLASFVEAPAELGRMPGETALFHVEQGQVRAADIIV